MKEAISYAGIWYWAWGAVLTAVFFLLVPFLLHFVSRYIRAILGTEQFVTLRRTLVVWASLAVASCAAALWLYWSEDLGVDEWVVDFIFVQQLSFAAIIMGLSELYRRPRLLKQYSGWGSVLSVLVILGALGVMLGTTIPIRAVVGIGTACTMFLLWHLLVRRRREESKVNTV